MQDFDLITENGKHLGPTGEFSPGQFQDMMTAELWRYSRRQLDNVLSVSGDEQFRSTILMLKILETSMHRSFKSLSDQFLISHEGYRAPHSSSHRPHSSSHRGGGGEGGEEWRNGDGGRTSEDVHAAEAVEEMGAKLQSILELVQGQAAAVAGLRAAHDLLVDRCWLSRA